MASGVRGKSCMRTPIALETAIAKADSGGIMGASPTPRNPNGCLGLGTSIITVSIMGTSNAVACGRLRN